MRCLARNRSAFYFALYDGKREIIDSCGNHTGQYELLYRKPTLCTGNISPAKGETQLQLFGESLSYDRVILMDSPKTPMDEYTVLWVDITPRLNPDGSLATNADGSVKTPHDYVVKGIARSQNSVSVAIGRVQR